jgi:hypothetical protein
MGVAAGRNVVDASAARLARRAERCGHGQRGARQPRLNRHPARTHRFPPRARMMICLTTSSGKRLGADRFGPDIVPRRVTGGRMLGGLTVWPYLTPIVARPKIKSTYALDQETVQRLERMARRWGVSKSEVLRRAIHAAARESSAVGTDAVSALDELQRSLRVSRAKAQAWAERRRAERRAGAARHECSTR